MSYSAEVLGLLRKLESDMAQAVSTVAQLLKKTVDQGGLLYVFGSGHSSILSEEAFHRAGGLIPVYPILQDSLTPHVSPKISGKLERLSGVADILFERAGVTSKDLLFIASNSGINAAAVEMAMAAQKSKVPTVAFTSLVHSKAAVSRHASKKKLYELCTHVLDNHAPVGDGVMQFGEVRVAAFSTIGNSFLYHSVLTQACALWQAEGKELPIYRSANLQGSDEWNAQAEMKYKNRIPLL